MLISPVNEATAADTSLAPRLSALRGKRVGLIDNSKSKPENVERSPPFWIRSMASAMSYATANPRPPKPVAPEVIDEFARTCDLVIAGVGD